MLCSPGSSCFPFFGQFSGIKFAASFGNTPLGGVPEWEEWNQFCTELAQKAVI
jgi:hypothetical protein